MEKEKMEILNIIESNFLMINENVKQINDLEIINIIENCMNNITEFDIKQFDNKMFNFNNELKNIKKSYSIDIKSYNIAMMDILSKYIYNITKKFKNKKFILILNNLNETERKIIDLIYEYDGIDSRTVKNRLNITSQYLYNITHNFDFLQLINIYDDYNRKFKHYSLKLNCRKYLDELYGKNQNNINNIYYKNQSKTKSSYFYYMNNANYDKKDKDLNIRYLELNKNKLNDNYKEKEIKNGIFKTFKKNNFYGKISID